MAEQRSVTWRGRGRWPSRFRSAAGRQLAPNKVITRFAREESGQDLIEYGLLVGIITVAVVIAIGVMGVKLTNYYTTLQGDLP
jgi:Flp pilus assembly pilin Flp